MAFTLSSFDELDAAQQARAAVLFVDHLCASDPRAFRYELTADGEIHGRIPLERNAARRSRRITQPQRLQLLTAADLSAEQIQRIAAARRRVAEMIVDRLYPEDTHGETQTLDERRHGLGDQPPGLGAAAGHHHPADNVRAGAVGQSL